MSADPAMHLEAAVARLSAQVEGVAAGIAQTRTDLGREIGQLRRDIADDLGGIRAELGAATEQVRATNGKVREHDLQLAESRARSDERARAQTDALQRADRRWVRLAWSLGIAASVLIAGVGWIIALLG